MELANRVESCEEIGHPNARAYLVHGHTNGSFESDCYCHDCDKPFIRSSKPEEIAEYRRIQSIPLTE